MKSIIWSIFLTVVVYLAAAGAGWAVGSDPMNAWKVVAGFAFARTVWLEEKL